MSSQLEVNFKKNFCVDVISGWSPSVVVFGTAVARAQFTRKPLILPRDRFGNPDYCAITKRHTMCNSEVSGADLINGQDAPR